MEEEKEFFAAVLGIAKPLTFSDREPSRAERQVAIAALDQAQIQRICDCGTCLTYNLLYPVEPEYQDLPRTYLAAASQDGEVLVLAQLEQGRLTSLEIAPIAETPVTALPDPGDLRA